MPESDPNKHPSRRYRALKPSGYEPESYEEYYGANEQAELWDIMQGVPPEYRFSGEFGLLPYLGYYGSGDPDDPAYGVSSINKYDIKNPEDLSQSILSGSAYFDTKRRIPRYERGDPDDPRVGGMLGWYRSSNLFPPNVPSSHDAVKENIRWVEGTGLADPGHSGIQAYYPLQDFAPLVEGELTPLDLDLELEAWDREVDLGDGAPENVYKPRFDPLSEDYYPFVSAEDMRTGKVDLEQPVWDQHVGFPSTVVHELIHRAFDTRAVRDFFDEMEDVGSFPQATEKTREWNRLHGGIDPRLHHDIIASRGWPPHIDTLSNDPDAPIGEGFTTKINPIETFQDQFLEWLTPERQAQYGIDLPDSEKLKAMGYQGGGPVSNAKSDFLDKLGSHRTDIMSRMREIDEMVPPDSPEFRLNHITAQNLDLTLTMLDKIADASAESPRYMTEAIDLVSQSLDDYLTLPFNAGGAEAINELMELIRYRVPRSSGAQKGPYLYDRFRALQTGTDRIYSDETGYKLGETPRETNVQQYKDLPYPEDDPTRDYELNRALLERARRESPLEWDRPGSLGGAAMPGRYPQANLVFEQLRRWDPYAEVHPRDRGLTVEEELNRHPNTRNRILNRAGGGFIDKLGIMGLQAGGDPSLADRVPLLPSDPLFIQDDLGYSPEVLSDMQAADVTFDPSLYPPLPPEEPNMMDFAKDRLIDVGQGFADIPGFVANYFVQPDEQGQPSFISPQEFGQDVKNVGMAMGQAIADDPVGFVFDITPGISNVRAGMEANRLYQQADEQEAQGDALGAAKTRSMASLTMTDMLNPLPTTFAVKGIFAGPMAQKAPQKLSDKRLDELEEVSDDTLAQEVFGETGAFITPDGRRAFEIDTSKATVDTARLNNMYAYMSPDQEPRVLPEVLDFPELYENYPQLKETKIKLDGSIDAIANYSLVTNTISINPHQAPPPIKGREGPLTSVVLHETQHAVQEIENYLRPEIFPQGFLAEPEYKGLPTEVEARNVQTRFENPEAKTQLPISTMDLPPSLFSNVDLLRERRKNYPSNDFPPTVFNKNVRPPIQYDLPFDAPNRPRTTNPGSRNLLDQRSPRRYPAGSPADTRDSPRRRTERDYAEGGIVSLANGGAVEHGVVTL